MTVLTAAAVKAPDVDFAGLSPLIALAGAAILCLMLGLFRSGAVRRGVVPVMALGGFLTSGALAVWQWNEQKSLLSGALQIDQLALSLVIAVCVAGALTVLLSLRSDASRQTGHGEYYALLLSVAAGMTVLVEAQNLVTVFLGLELLSIPLYVLCAGEVLRSRSLEAGLKYLIIGSVGSATLLYGLALIYGATGATDFAEIGRQLTASGEISSDPLFLAGCALIFVGLAFKASVAPFHQWTPDVYEGAPTAITAFMAATTKVAVFGLLLRFTGTAIIDAAHLWAPALAVLAAVTIVVGNVGALGQLSLKRMLAYSSVAQAGYLLVGVVPGTDRGVTATVFYLAVYLVMNLAAFAVIVLRERESQMGDSIDSVRGLGRTSPLLAWPLTIAMLALAGLPATAGFIGKIYLIEAAAASDYVWLGIAIVIGSMISLAYYLRVVATMWMSEPEEREPAGLRGLLQPEVTTVALVAGAVTVVLGIAPSLLYDAIEGTGTALSQLIG